jgi:2,3-bisphosphoglycerate-independent phosphoglycerate mutase
MGNSEVGHMNLGSGRVVYQDLTKIDKAIQDGTFFENAVLQSAMKGRLHLLGLCSPGGVHSSLEHMYALVELAKRQGVREIYIHAFLDGRDTPPKSAAATLRAVQARLATIGAGKIATIDGRYWAMDRDQRWERVADAYRLLTEGVGTRASDPVAAVEASYAAGVNDEFVKPMVIDENGILRDGDSVLFFNFRAGRVR